MPTREIVAATLLLRHRLIGSKRLDSAIRFGKLYSRSNAANGRSHEPAGDRHSAGALVMTVDSPKPPVVWNGKAYDICLPWPEVPKRPWVEVQVTPQVTYVVRVRESGTDTWLVGVETPLTSCTLVELKPNTEYEMEVRARNAAGEGDPAVVICRTGPDGAVEPLSIADA